MMAFMLVGEFAKVGTLTWTLGALPLGGVRLWVGIGLLAPPALAVAYGLATHLGAGPMSLPYAYASAGVATLGYAAFRMSGRAVTLSPGAIAIAAAGILALALLAFAAARP